MTNIRTPAQLAEALAAIVEEFKATEPSKIKSEDLGRLAIAIKNVSEFTEALDIQLNMRVVTNGELIAGVSTKPEVKHRKWNDEDEVAALAFEQFGLKAFKLQNPAAIEKLGDEGKALVAIASTKPEAGRKVTY